MGTHPIFESDFDCLADPKLKIMAPKGGATAAEAEKTKPTEKEALEKLKETGVVADTDLSDEDQELKDELNLCIERLGETDVSLYAGSLAIMREKIRSSTSSLTSVPKPLKFLREHFDVLKQIHEKLDGENKKICADVLSCLSMVMSEKRECLHYRLIGSDEDIGGWGHEYVRHLAGEVGAEWNDKITENAEYDTSGLMALVKKIVPYDMKHNSETDCTDLLMEIEHLEMLIEAVDQKCYKKVCLYLRSCVPYAPDPENTILMKTAMAIYSKFEKHCEALVVALQLNDEALIEDIFAKCNDATMKKQLAYILGRMQRFIELPDEMDEAEELQEIMSNSHLNTNFLALARELDIMEPKQPEDIYKSHLEKTTANVDSARANLASSYVNAFVNAGFGQDKLLSDEGQKWIYKNKDHGMVAATASLGLILLWDVDGGLTQIDKYLYSTEDPIKAGALLACGIVNSGIRTECDPALALLSDYVLHQTLLLRKGSVLGLGIAYAGTNREDVIQKITPLLSDPKSDMAVIGFAALALGLISVGSCNSEVTSTILQCIIEKPESQLNCTMARYLALGLGLCYLGKQEQVETILAALEVCPEPLRAFANILVEVCAYAGTGNVLKIQQLLHICSEPPKEEDEEDKKEVSDDKKDKKKDKKEKKEEKKDSKLSSQAAAVIGIALIAMGEDIGSEMSFRSFGHLLRYGEPSVRRAVPLAIAMTSVSNPQLHIVDTLSKFSHDSDGEVAYNSILAMGLVGAGTNNARLAQMLRQLAVYYQKDANALFMVRQAQGFVHLGKGTLTLNPFQADKTLMNVAAAAALITTAVTCLDSRQLILGKNHFLLYSIVPAIQPRLLVCLDEECRPLQVSVRVGQAVDVVGQAGKPKTITGFQTRTTPVLLSHGERAELASDEWIPLSSVLEGFVILKKNPNSIDAPKDKK